MIPRLRYDIEGLGAAKPQIPGYVTSESCSEQVQKVEATKLLVAGAAALIGVAAGALVSLAIVTSTRR